MPNRIPAWAFLLFCCYTGFAASAQQILEGQVIDGATRAPLPFANIGVRHRGVGTAARADGTFTLPLPPAQAADTLTFSMVGYADRRVPIRELLTTRPAVIGLSARATALPVATVTGTRLTERRFGIVRSAKLLHFLDGSVQQDDVFEIAQVVHLGPAPAQLTTVNLDIADTRTDSATFRLNFYGFDGQRPTGRISEQRIVRRVAIRAGWLRFDIRTADVWATGDCVVGLEFLPAPRPLPPITYEVKLGGGARSFVRTGSLADWAVPPHHYRLYVSALVPERAPAPANAAEEREAAPTVRLFSAAVRDSFSVFVRLPAAYARHPHRRYPVVLVLDGNAYFDILGRELPRAGAADAILVGVGYRDAGQLDSLRDRDYTFPAPLPTDSMPQAGGGAAFLQFLQTELISHLDHHYRTDTTRRLLLGHSLGGYFVLWALLENQRHHRTPFRGYVAASPSLQYHEGYLIGQFAALPPASAPAPALYVNIGEREIDPRQPEGAAEKARWESLQAALRNLMPPGGRLQQEVMPGAEHMETAVPGFVKGVRRVGW